MGNFKEKLSLIKAFVFDVDGVLSGSKVMLHPDGELIRTLHIKDSYAIQYALKKGYIIGIITGGNSDNLRSKLNNLGITDVYMKSVYKKEDLDDFKCKYHLETEEILYMGDDIPDLEPMHLVGCPVCPANAAEEIKNISIYISDKEGGEGCARDVIEQVLKLQNNWMDADLYHW